MVSINGPLGEKFLKTGIFSDFVIVCQGREFPVHRVIISANSTFFRGVCCQKFLEYAEGRVTLKEQGVGSIQRVLHYIYIGNYNDELSEDIGEKKKLTDQLSEDELQNEFLFLESLDDYTPQSPVEANVLVYQAAEAYGIQGLKELATKKFMEKFRAEICTHSRGRALHLVYRLTRHKDAGLRLAATRLCIGLQILNPGSTSDDEPDVRARKLSAALVKIVEDHEPLAFKICSDFMFPVRELERCGRCGKESPETGSRRWGHPFPWIVRNVFRRVYSEIDKIKK